MGTGSSVDKYQLAVGQQGQHKSSQSPSNDRCQNFFDLSGGLKQSATPRKALGMAQGTEKANGDLLQKDPVKTKPNARTSVAR
ncbi:Hypp1330 [Branchiostoma lanceolatum]|uniref:Hypp1330 protein n=1 Tax=Branchiostoma lanceolatum TaxID=7740 RepID=A0A8J9ZIG3_BRALA|nr:Hypp1330 [Branchiostoma lanceolatum]